MPPQAYGDGQRVYVQKPLLFLKIEFKRAQCRTAIAGHEQQNKDSCSPGKSFDASAFNRQAPPVSLLDPLLCIAVYFPWGCSVP
jgi:hypothetical protein